jgi:hypothetical protein
MFRLILAFVFLISFTSTECISQVWKNFANGVEDSNYELVYATTEFNNKIVIGGYFTSVSGVNARNVAIWDGTSWQALGNGLLDNVLSLAVHNGELYAGCDAEGSQTLFKWNGTTWLEEGNFKGPIFALYRDNATGTLYAGGRFTSPGVFVAKKTTGAWSAVGTNQSLNQGSFAAVYALTVYKGELYIGGTFQPSTHSFFAKWNGSAWVAPHAQQPNNSIYAFSQYRDTLYIGGNFTRVGNHNPDNPEATRFMTRIMKWHGTDYLNFYGNITGTNARPGPQGEVNDIIYYNGEIYITGTFKSDLSDPDNPISGFIGVSGAAFDRIARWNGYLWQPLGQGLDGTGNKLAVIRDTLLVGGYFSSAGNVSGTKKIAQWYNPFIGCMDPDFWEYHPDVDISHPDSCKTPKAVSGCMDQNFLEYDPIANISDPSACLTPVVRGCTDQNFVEYNPAANLHIQDSCRTIAIYGCTNPAYIEYNPGANIHVESLCQTLAIPGCTNINYWEYNPNATVHVQDSCINGRIVGCINPNYKEYNPNANVHFQDSCKTWATGINPLNISGIQLLSVYPNPYSGQTNIVLTLDEAKYLQVEIYNYVGQKIENLLSGMQQPGEYKLKFSAANQGLSKGIYILRISTEEENYWLKLLEQ